MRALPVFVLFLFLVPVVAGCGLECGDGTEEKDGECVVASSSDPSSPMTDEEVWVRCTDVCNAEYPQDQCRERCVARASGVGPRICQNCLVDAFSYRSYELLTAALDACVPLCTD